MGVTYHIIALSILISLSYVLSACPSPEIPDNVYALTEVSGSYVTGAVFDLVCVPGRRPDTVVQLRCDSSGKWLGHWPDCSKSESKAKWWMLLIGVVGVVILIPCIVPRLYFTFIDTSPPRKDMLVKRRGRRANSASDRIRGIEMQTITHDISHVPAAAIYYEPPKYPVPLPSKRQKNYVVNGEGFSGN